MEKIKIKYFSPDIERIQKFDVGNWIDLRAAENCYRKLRLDEITLRED